MYNRDLLTELYLSISKYSEDFKVSPGAKRTITHKNRTHRSSERLWRKHILLKGEQKRQACLRNL